MGKRSNPYKHLVDDLIPSGQQSSAPPPNKFVANPNEVICYCLGIRAEEIIEFIEKNPDAPMDDVIDEFGSGAFCKTCIPDIEEIRLLILSRKRSIE